MTTTQTTELVEVSPEMVQEWINDGDTVLVDVREDFEYATERIESAHHHSLSGFDPEKIREQFGDRRIVFHCRTGKRSSEAATKFGGEHAFHLRGGIEGWKATGRHVHRSASAPKLDIMRQVQIVAGFLIVLGVGLGNLLNPWLYAISAFVGCGLMFAGISGWCGMAKLLAGMPWNSAAVSCCSNGSCTTNPDSTRAS